MKLRHAAAAAVLAASFALPAAAIAQNAAGNAEPSPSQMDQRVKQHIARLHAQLQITPQQEQQWNRFAQIMWDNAHDMRTALMQREASLRSMNAAQDMDSYAHLAEVHAADMQRLSAAFHDLYASMTPAQQQNASRLFTQDAERHIARRHNQQG
ncbi:MAG TPA: Spy/CpxP family protein refolding chaperone [Acetobacteraceae bacterium]|nr:Spy/CpxP family protein refolding chaperone [Acetobacteraceae bacterium]